MSDFQFPPLAVSFLDKEGNLSPVWRRWFLELHQREQAEDGNYTGTVTLAKITSGGVNGLLTFLEGSLVTVVPPT